MRPYLNTILLALIWVAITGSFTLANLIAGFALGAVALSLIRHQGGTRVTLGGIGRIGRILSLACFFLYELALSALKVAMLVLSPKMNLKPGIFAYSLTVDRDFEIALLANMITLTPGTLSVDVSDDRRTLYVHAIDCSDPEQTRRDIADGFERKILEAFR